MSFLNSLFGGDDATRAAESEAAGFRGAGQTFTDASSTFSPFTTSGVAALGRVDRTLGGDFSDFREDPGYQFALDQGRRTIDSSAASRGLALSGRQLRALTEYGQGVADQQYNNFINRNLNVAQLGLNSANSQLSAASGAANAQIGEGTSIASGHLANANITNGLSNSLLQIGSSLASGGAPA